MNAPHESEYYYKEIVDQLSEILRQPRGVSITAWAKKIMKHLDRGDRLRLESNVSKPKHSHPKQSK